MCNCYNEMREKIKERIFPDATFIFNMDMDLLSGRTLSHYEVTIPGKRKKEEIVVGHSYCPHCGKRYEEEPT